MANGALRALRLGSADNIPKACNLPTGLGKTSVIAIWLIALANGKTVPRRLVYLVNRRTVVDQTTVEVEKYFAQKVPGIPEFAISTLRGQFADNREWSADPSRPAVICGTVDMIGSRLLFSGYGVGFKGKPVHAGFLGQDALLIHDEAHLEPAFQKLIEAIETEQERCQEFRRFRVMELTATSRSDEKPFELTQAELAQPEEIPVEAELPIHRVWQRLIPRRRSFQTRSPMRKRISFRRSLPSPSRTKTRSHRRPYSCSCGRSKQSEKSSPD